MKLSRAAIVVAVSVPPTQIGLDSQYKTAVTAPAARPKDIRAHSYGRLSGVRGSHLRFLPACSRAGELRKPLVQPG